MSKEDRSLIATVNKVKLSRMSTEKARFMRAEFWRKTLAGTNLPNNNAGKDLHKDLKG